MHLPGSPTWADSPWDWARSPLRPPGVWLASGPCPEPQLGAQEGPGPLCPMLGEPAKELPSPQAPPCPPTPFPERVPGPTLRGRWNPGALPTAVPVLLSRRRAQGGRDLGRPAPAHQHPYQTPFSARCVLRAQETGKPAPWSAHPGDDERHSRQSPPASSPLCLTSPSSMLPTWVWPPPWVGVGVPIFLCPRPLAATLSCSPCHTGGVIHS